MFIVLNVSLKIDNVISWDWATVFWPVWLALCMTSLICLCLFFLCLGMLFSWLMKETQGRDVLVSVWILVCLISFNLSFGSFFISLAEMLEDNSLQVTPFSFPLAFTVAFYVSMTLINNCLV
jgi:hypothetical protein